MNEGTTKKKPNSNPRKPICPIAPTGYGEVLADLKRVIDESHKRAVSSVNRELVLL